MQKTKNKNKTKDIKKFYKYLIYYQSWKVYRHEIRNSFTNEGVNLNLFFFFFFVAVEYTTSCKAGSQKKDL